MLLHLHIYVVCQYDVTNKQWYEFKSIVSTFNRLFSYDVFKIEKNTSKKSKNIYTA